MSNRLLDRYRGRGVLHTPLNHSRKGYLITRQTIWGRMLLRPTLPAEKSDFKGWCEVMSETRGDEYVFHFSMSNRLSDRYRGRGVLHTPLNHSRKGYLIARQTIVGRMQYAPTFPEKIRFPRVCVFYCLGQWRINTYFFSPCLIGYQIGTRVGRKSIRPLHVYRLPPRPLQGVGWGVCNTPLPCRKKIRFPWEGVFHCLGQSKTNTYIIPPCLIGYQTGKRVVAYCIRPLRVYRLPQRPLQGVWWGVCNTPLHFRKKIRFPWVCVFYRLGQSETNTYFIPSCLIGYQMSTRVGAQKHTPLARLSSTPTPLRGVW